MTSAKSNSDFMINPIGLPSEFKFDNYINAFIKADMGVHFGITIIVTVVSVFLIVFFASLAAFGFSKLKFPGQKILYPVFLIGLILPIQSYIVGMFILFKQTYLLNTIWAMILPNVALMLPLSILLIKACFDSLPLPLIESAIIEGADTFHIYRKIMLPLAQAIVITVIVFSTLISWNEFLIPYIMVQNKLLKPLSTSIYVFSTLYTRDITMQLAATAIIATPMFIVYFIFQKQITKGLTAGGIKA